MRLVRRAFERRAAQRMIAARGIGKLQADATIRDCRARRRFKAVANAIELHSGWDFGDEADRALARNRDIAAAQNSGRKDESRADERVLPACAEFVRVAPKRREHRMRGLQRVDAELRHPEIGGLADDF